MGNLVAESGLVPTNLQNNYERSLGMNDAQYTAAVDNGSYGNFVRDSAGYGLAQWTYWSRKQGLLEYARGKGVSIGDLEMQLEFLLKELAGYGLLNTLKGAASIRSASDVVLLQYEKPADQSENAKQKRAQYGQEVYSRQNGNAAPAPAAPQTQAAARRFSPLVTGVVDFGTRNSNPRKNKVAGITPHHMAGIMTGEQCAKYHYGSGKEHSANYYVGNAGDRYGGVPENRRAWTTGTGNGEGTNDHTHITLEISNSKASGDYPISDAAYRSTVELCAEICTYYGITPHYDGTKNGTITMHKQFAATACPGPYLERLITSGQFERDILAAMGKVTPQKPATPTPQTPQEETKAYPATPFYAKASRSVNIRKNASPTSQIVGSAKKGVYTVVAVNGNWGKLKSGAGWINLAASTVTVTKTLATASGNTAATSRWKGKVDAKSGLNMRVGAGTEYDRVPAKPLLTDGTVVEVIKAVKAKDGADWYYVMVDGGISGYVSGQYITRL